MLETGFLFRTADRNRVQDYWKTIDVEQGGHFDPTNPQQSQLLDAIAYFVNYALPLPVAPTTDATKRARGQQLFGSLGCSGCHSGSAYTDSGAGNPTLDLSGPLTLHDVGTCVTSGYPDVAHADEDGHPRAACAFDTPSLRGVWDSAPYLHDGSKATLDDVLAGPASHVGGATMLSADDHGALVEFLKSL
jgi:cytochrome c peroxidase